MKKIILACAILTFLVSCKKEYATFGESISADGAISKEEMITKFKDLKDGDTINVTFKSKTKEVCQSKGCWMTMELDEESEAVVKFKDYAFFVPKNGQDKETIVKGKAYVSVESVAQLKHLAKDAGKSQAAIDSISSPKVAYSFMADGVLMAK